MMKNWAKWAYEQGQITKIWLSDGCGGETIPMTVRIGYNRHEFESYLGNFGSTYPLEEAAYARLY